MKNLKNIIASIILVVISFVSYTQDTLKYEFYLTDSTDIGNVNVDTSFTVTNIKNPSDDFSLSGNTWDLGKLNYNMNFTMDSTIYRVANNNDILVTDTAYVTGIFLISEDYGVDYQYFDTDLAKVETAIFTHEEPYIDYIDNIEDFITTLIDSTKTYTHVVFKIKHSDDIYTSFEIIYDPGTASIDTEVIEVSNTRVYPNPVMNSLNIEFETINTDTEVEIYSTNGQLMYKDVEYRNFGINKVSVDMSNYPSGMYIVRLGNEVKKVIKQ